MTDPEYKLTRTYINHTDNTQVTVEVTTPNRNPDELKQKVDKKASSILNYNTVGDLFSDWDGKGVHYGWGNAPWGKRTVERSPKLSMVFDKYEPSQPSTSRHHPQPPLTQPMTLKPSSTALIRTSADSTPKLTTKATSKSTRVPSLGLEQPLATSPNRKKTLLRDQLATHRFFSHALCSTLNFP